MPVHSLVRPRLTLQLDKINMLIAAAPMAQHTRFM